MAALYVRPSSLPKILAKPLTLASPLFRRTFCSLSSSLRGRSSFGCHPSTPASATAIRSLGSSAASTANPFTIADSEEALTGFVTGRKRATEAAHLVWKSIIRKGDTVIDATCGNGHDTLALVKMVADEFGTGCVYAMDFQNAALESTRYLLEAEAEENERKLVKLILLCHSKMEEIVPRDASVRVVTFNLGYLPGGDKTFITRSPTTLSALEAASRILDRGGLVSILAYVGHPGGRDEFETVQSFASSLPVESWITCKLERLNQSAAPVLVFLYKR